MSFSLYLSLPFCICWTCRRRSLHAQSLEAEERLSSALEALRLEVSTRCAAEAADKLSLQREELEKKQSAEMETERKRASEEM